MAALTAYLWSAPPDRIVGGEAMTLRLMLAARDAGIDCEVLVATAKVPGTWSGLPLRSAGDVRTRLPQARVVVTHPELTSRVRRLPGQTTIHIVHNLGKNTLAAIGRRRHDVLIANSASTAAGLTARGHPPDLTLYPPVETPTPPVEGLPRRFVTAVNLSEAKGGDLFYAAAEAMPGVPFLGVVGGHGEQYRPGSVPSNVTIVGHGPIGLPLALTRVLMAPSRSETYGMTVAEATLAGLPVVASDLPAHREVLGESGRFVPDGGDWPAALADALQDDGTGARSRAAAIRSRTDATLRDWLGLLASLGV